MRLTFQPFPIELKHRWTISRGSFDRDTNFLVSIAHEDLTGFGECCSVERYGQSEAVIRRALAMASKLFARRDPWQFQTNTRLLRERVPAVTTVHAAIDMAVKDWIGKKIGVPLYRYWGLESTIAPVSSFSIGIDTTQIIRKKIAETPDDPILKIKLGGQWDEEIMATVRRETSRPVRVDANEGWRDAETAARKIEWLAKMQVEFVEQPLPTGCLDETARLRQMSALPIFADEDCHTAADIPRLSGIYDGINIKLMKAGGLDEARTMIEVAHRYGLQVMLGCMLETSLGITAAAHLAPLADALDLDSHRLLKYDPFCGIEVVQGKISLPSLPGLGVTPRD